jgi:spore coat protein CotH
MGMRLKFQRHYKLLVLLAVVSLVLTLGLGEQRIIAYTVPGRSAVAVQGIDNPGEVPLFDDSVVHSIQILMSDADYQQMITTYQQAGEKEYFAGDVIIDGVRVENVGIRLKGNASLRMALGGGGGLGAFGRRQGPGAEGQALPFDPGNLPEGGDGPQPPTGGRLPGLPGRPMPNQGELPANPGGGELAERPQGVGPGGDLPFVRGMGPGGDVAPGSGEGGAKVPLMIKFDEFVPGQTYQEYKSLAIRTYGTSGDAAMLQEPVTNAIFRLAGLPAPQTAYAGVRRNDEAEQLYVISEVINDTYLLQHFANPDGVLYKAELGSTLAYQGEDPSAYASRFTQQTRVNDADLAPLIALMRFLSESDETTFERDLPAYLDVDSFATYLAINNLLVNVDSIAGMNNNYYLYYDDAAQRFTLLMWDGNESLGKLAASNQATTYDLYYQDRQGMGGRMGGSNLLVTRFLANPAFGALYEQKLEEVYRQAFVGGAIVEQIEQYSTLVRQVCQERGLADVELYDRAVVSVLDFVARRAAYLATTSLLGGAEGSPG